MVIPLLMSDRRQAVFVINDENPLVFKESVKHKMTNMIRVLGLKMSAGQQVQRLDQDLFCNDLGVLQSNMLERMIHREIQRSALFPEIHTWVCMYTFDEVNSIRTRFGLDVLKQLQRQIVKRSSEEVGHANSVTTFHADYIYVALVQSDSEKGLENWKKHLNLDHPYPCGKDYIKLSFRTAEVKVERAYSDAHELLQRVKRAFSEETRKAQMREV